MSKFVGWGMLGRGALRISLALFILTATYQAALVLRILNWGHRGHAPPGHRILLVAWIVMVVAGLGLFSIRLAVALFEDATEDGLIGDRIASAMQTRRLLPLLSLAAAAAVVIGFYAPDPYYLNTNGSVEDGGTVSRTQIAVVVVMAAVASAAARFSPRRGFVLTSVSLWCAAITLAAEGTNH